MKFFFTAVWAIICVVVLFYGHSYWSQRTAIKAGAEQQKKYSVTQKAAKTNEPNVDVILAKAQNWPDSARQQLQQTLKENKPFKILFVGSAALGTKDKGMLKDVVQQVTDTYGKDHIDISVHTYDATSKEFLANNDQQEIAAEKAQLIVFEPFLLNDNGKVAIGDSLNNLTKVIDAVKAATPETTFVLQPSYPLFGAKFYPAQVDKLKQYADQNKLAYLDHWTAWPAPNNKQLTNYLSPDQSGPNEKGNQVWSQYLINYLIHK